MRIITTIAVVFINLFPGFGQADELPFNVGEQLHYNIKYNWGKIWMDAGIATFAVEGVQLREKHTLHLTGYGTTLKKYDWFYKVRDTYESWIDPATLRSLKFSRNVKEGGFYMLEKHLYDHKNKRVFSYLQKKKKTPKQDTIAIKSNTRDILGAMVQVRCIDFSNAMPNDTIWYSIVIDREVHNIYIRYVGSEEKEVPGLGRFRCNKFKAWLIEGTIFKGGENMEVWVTDDLNNVPVYITTSILVGSIQVSLAKHENLKYPLDSKL